MKRISFIAAALLSFHVSGSFNDNLIPHPDFHPVVIDGEITAAKGWAIVDYGRNACLKNPEYLDGRRCLKLKFEKPGTMTIEFCGKENLPEKYFGKRFVLFPTGCGWVGAPELIVPAPAYRVRYQLKISQGQVILPDKRTVKASKDFQNLDYLVKNPIRLANGKMEFIIHPNLEFTIRQASVTPVYPANRNRFIRLPDGGRLTRIIVAEDADFQLRLGAMVWRGWLWKLTGIALPVETRQDPVPEKGALVIVKGDSAPGGYRLKIDRNGGLLTVRASRDAQTSTFNYIRKLGVRLYSRDTQKIPAPDANLTLAAADENLIPRFRFFMGPEPYSYLNGGGGEGELMTESDWLDFHRKTEFHGWCNQLVPMEFYQKSHPEYYMQDGNGKRQKTSNPFFLTLCLTNPEVHKIAARRFPQYMRSNDSGFTGICMGDRPVSCQCPSCRELNGSDTSVSNSMIAFQNILADSMRNAMPGTEKKILYTAYHNYRFPPTKIKPAPGIQVIYCVSPRTMPCMVHIDCEINRRALADYRQWSKLVGKENLGACMYEESRPYYEGRLLEYLNRFGSNTFYYFTFAPEKRSYVAGRFRFGDDPVKAQDEFIDGYYGAGGKYIKQIYRTVDEYCKNYKHTEEDKREFCVAVLPPRTTKWKTVLSREILDQSYELFDRALEAVGKNPILREHILYDKYCFLMADLPKYPRSVCRNEKETRAFGKRLGDFMRTLIELDELQKKNPFKSNRVRNHGLLNTASEKDFLLAVSGLDIPAPRGKRQWFECKEIQNFLKDPENAFIGKSGVKTIPGGYEWDAMSMFGGDGPQVFSAGGEKRSARVIRRPHSGKGTVSVVLNLKSVPKHNCRLILEGLDDDKPGAAEFRVVVNGKEIFSGANTFSETAWSVMGIDIPRGTLKAGENRIEISNTMKELPSDRRKLPQTGIDLGDVYETDYFRGWILLDKIRLLDFSGEFAKLTAGKGSLWQKSVNPNYFDPDPVFEAADGKLHLATDKKQVRAGVGTIAPRHYAVTPGEKLKISALVSGKGIFSLNYTCLGTNGKYNRKSPRKNFKAAAEEEWVVWETTVPEGTAFILPGMIVCEGGDCRIADYKIESIKP